MSDQDQHDANAEELTDELARKYDPERMLRMVSRRAGKGERLEHSIRAKYEARFGVDLGHVRVYTGEFAEEFNRKRNAYAVTVGSTGMILMGGSPDKSMASSAGQALLAHELTHVAQATRGLKNRGQFDNTLAFTQHDEAEAHAHEHAVESEAKGQGATSAQADANMKKMEAEKKMKERIEKIKARVIELMGDAARNQEMRNGFARRP